MVSKSLWIGKSIEFIYCGCGCGFTTSKYKIERDYYPNYKKPKKFIKGHNMLGTKQSETHRQHNREARLGKPLTEQHRKNISKGITGSGNPMYGKHHSQETKKKIGKANTKETVGYSRLHVRIRNRLPKPIDGKCELCHIKPIYEVANKWHTYEEDLNNWAWMCRSCHKKHDYKLKNGHVSA